MLAHAQCWPFAVCCLRRLGGQAGVVVSITDVRPSPMDDRKMDRSADEILQFEVSEAVTTCVRVEVMLQEVWTRPRPRLLGVGTSPILVLNAQPWKEAGQPSRCRVL